MKRDVVVAGWGQVTQPKQLETIAKDPMGLMAQAARKAALKLTDPTALTRVDGIMVVRSLSTHYEAPAAQLAALLGASPRFMTVSKIGGNSPQTLVNKAAAMIARNELDSILVVGAEAYVQRDEKLIKEESALLRGIPKNYPGDDITGSTRLENLYGIEHPMQGFPLFETALWAASGLDLPAYLQRIGTLWAGFSQVAASHPHSWSKSIKTSEETALITIPAMQQLVLTDGLWPAKNTDTAYLTRALHDDQTVFSLVSTYTSQRTFSLTRQRSFFISSTK